MGYSHGRHLQGWHNASAQFEKELLSQSESFTKATQSFFISEINDFMVDLQKGGQAFYPIYTANLHDSIVGVVANRGRVVSAAYMPTQATRPQHTYTRKRIIGIDEAVNAVRENQYPSRGVSATLIVAVPYAEGANESSLTNKGYLNRLESYFERFMDGASRSLATYKSYGRIPSVKPSKTRFSE